MYKLSRSLNSYYFLNPPHKVTPLGGKVDANVALTVVCPPGATGPQPRARGGQTGNRSSVLAARLKMTRIARGETTNE